VLFVHGAGTPAEVAFDVPYRDYSWMAYLARSGFDVFSMDVTGYGRSTRPSVMNDPCNVSAAQQAQLVPLFLEAPCTPDTPGALGTIQSDWDDIAAVVDYIRGLRDVESVSLVGWSLGGPRTGGYAIRNPDKVSRMVLLAPAYNRNGSADPPAAQPGIGAPMTLQSNADFTRNWDRQVGCTSQYDPEVSRAVWAEMMLSDPVGETWGAGVRRAPRTTTWGWNADVAGDTRTPILIVAGIHDAQVPADRARDLYEDWGAEEKVFIDLGCASHNAMWEENHLLLFEASREWLSSGTVQGMESGVLRMGYE
jgi:pimeloyl-ACP methyl ester carboxylesterase